MATPSPQVTPKSLLLDLVRVAPGGEVPVSSLVGAGALFGITGNAIRVALARLQAAGLIENTGRGSYALSPAAKVLGRQVEEWRLGDARLRPWTGAWLCVHLPKAVPVAARRASLKALLRLGFREGLAGMWVRPDNLKGGLSAAREKLAALGLESGAAIFLGEAFSKEVTDRWEKDLWPLDEIESAHERALADLERSTPRISRLSRPEALAETFRLGGAAIRSLALDPLLPDEILSGETRRALTQAMKEYDVLGKQIWGAVIDESRPRQLAAVG